MTGTAPAELISVMAAAHRAFEPRTSDEGRRPRSIRAAILSTPSKAPLTTTSRRTRGPSSFHLFLATRTPCAVISPAASGPARDPARDPLADDSVGQEICGRATLDAGSRKRSQPARRAAEASIEAELVALGVLHDHKAGFHAAVGVDPANRVAPRSARRVASASSAAIRSSPTLPGAARTSRCSRFLAVLPSGTRWKNSRGPDSPSGGSAAERLLCSWGGTPQASSALSQLSKPAGGGCTW